MPLERRIELLKLASERDFIIIEDDYEFETNYVNEPCPALKSLDDEGRVMARKADFPQQREFTLRLRDGAVRAQVLSAVPDAVDRG